MSETVAVQYPSSLENFAGYMRSAAHVLLRATSPHPPIGAGPRGLLAPVDAANDRAHARHALFAGDGFLVFGGLAYVADYIAVKLPGVDQESSIALGNLGRRAMYSVPWPETDLPRPDPRFVSPAAPR